MSQQLSCSVIFCGLKASCSIATEKNSSAAKPILPNKNGFVLATKMYAISATPKYLTEIFAGLFKIWLRGLSQMNIKIINVEIMPYRLIVSCRLSSVKLT